MKANFPCSNIGLSTFSHRLDSFMNSLRCCELSFKLGRFELFKLENCSNLGRAEVISLKHEPQTSRAITAEWDRTHCAALTAAHQHWLRWKLRSLLFQCDQPCPTPRPQASTVETCWGGRHSSRPLLPSQNINLNICQYCGGELIWLMYKDWSVHCQMWTLHPAALGSALWATRPGIQCCCKPMSGISCHTCGFWLKCVCSECTLQSLVQYN